MSHTFHPGEHPEPDTARSSWDDIDPEFVFDFTPYDDPDDDTGERWSTWWSVEPLCRGPEPRPDWIVTSRGAIDTELGILKTGKEADVFLLRREDPQLPGTGVTMAAKRYRDPDHRTFHRSAAYSEGRRERRSRDSRAMAKKSAYGRAIAAARWAEAEWQALVRLWSLGVPVPYPVQIDGTEILMEWITHDGETAPRLAPTRPGPDLLASYFAQLGEAMGAMAEAGVVHGDLSPYNILAAGDRLIIIDLPQLVDLVANPSAMDFLMRDCTNVCRWFSSRGLDVDEHELFGDFLARAF